MPRYTLNRHALQRAQEMGLNVAQVSAVIEGAEVDYASRGRRVAAKDGLAVVYDPDRLIVVTVLYRSQEEWQRRRTEAS